MNESTQGERTASELQDRVTELIEQQTAISDVLRAIASSPHDLQPIFGAILDGATRLCRADICSLRLCEESGLRRVAIRGDALSVSEASSFPVLAEMQRSDQDRRHGGHATSRRVAKHPMRSGATAASDAELDRQRHP